MACRNSRVTPKRREALLELLAAPEALRTVLLAFASAGAFYRPSPNAAPNSRNSVLSCHQPFSNEA